MHERGIQLGRKLSWELCKVLNNERYDIMKVVIDLIKASLIVIKVPLATFSTSKLL